MNWFLLALKNYAAFEGRASRKEFWYFVLFFIIIALVAGLIDSIIGMPVLSAITFLGLLIPSISVSVRRLHDTGRSGWWYLLSLVPIVSLVLLVFFAMDSKSEENPYGAAPVPA